MKDLYITGNYEKNRMASLLFTNELVLVLILVTVLSFAYYYRSYLFLLLKVRPRKIVKKTIREKKFEAISIKKCPNCRQNMENGYISGRGFYWNRNSPALTYFNKGFTVGAEPLSLFSSILHRAMRQECFKAYRCRKCNIVYIDLKEQQPLGL